MKTSKVILSPLTPEQATKQALEVVEKERTGEQYGLKCRFNSLNVAMGKYFRFNSVNLFAGLSGHGKSYFLNVLTEDFLDYRGEDSLNKNIDFIPVVIHFCFEMSAYNEILRSAASDLGVSYSYLLSSEYDKETGEYNQLTEEEVNKVKEYLKFYKTKSILFYENAGNVKLLFNTVEHIYNSYKKHSYETGKKYKFVVNIDHTLLIETLDEKSSAELMANVGKIAISIRKLFGAMVNLLGQLNNNIEDVKRIVTKSLHYPTKSDIYAQGQLYNACDNVFVIHQPQLLKITEYGTRKIPTNNLIHLLKLKARHGRVGSIWFLDYLSKGQIIEKPKEVENLEDEELNDENLEYIE